MDDYAAIGVRADGNGTEQCAIAGVIDESISNQLTYVNRIASRRVGCGTERGDVAGNDGARVCGGIDTRDADAAVAGRSERAFSE